MAAISGAAGLLASAVLYGWFDYMANPNCFREGKRPSPSDRSASGKVSVTPDNVTAGSGHGQFTVEFTAGEGGISEDGGMKIGLSKAMHAENGVFMPEPNIFNGWGIFQNTRPQLPNYFSCSVESDNPVRLDVEKKGVLPVRFFFRCCAREFMRHCGVILDPLDYSYLYSESSKVKVRIRDCRLNEGDRITITLGDTSGGGRGWKIPAASMDTDLFVEVDERALGVYRPIAEMPSIKMTPKPKTEKRMRKIEARRRKSVAYSGRT